jgi:hypothetical protein
VALAFPLPGGTTRGFACSRRIHTMDGEHSDHSSHDDSSTADGGIATEYRPPLQATSCPSREVTSATSCSVAHCHARNSTTAKQAHRQASRYHGLATRATTTGAHARSSGQGSGSPCQPRGGPDGGHCGQPLNASPPLTANGVDKIYRQLAKIHAIATAQLAECAYW